MFEAHFYEDRQGRQPIKDDLLELRDKAHTSKDARIQYEKILTYIRALENYGTRIGESGVAMTYKPIEIDRKNLTIMGVHFPDSI